MGGAIASVLSRSSGNSMEEIITDLINAVNVEELQYNRVILFTNAIGVILECNNLENKSPSDLRLNQWRGAKANVLRTLCVYLSTCAIRCVIEQYIAKHRCGKCNQFLTHPNTLYDLIGLPPSSQDLQSGHPGPGGSSPSLIFARSSSLIDSPFLANKPISSGPMVSKSGSAIIPETTDKPKILVTPVLW